MLITKRLIYISTILSIILWPTLSAFADSWGTGNTFIDDTYWSAYDYTAGDDYTFNCTCITGYKSQVLCIWHTDITVTESSVYSAVELGMTDDWTCVTNGGANLELGNATNQGNCESRTFTESNYYSDNCNGNNTNLLGEPDITPTPTSSSYEELIITDNTLYHGTILLLLGFIFPIWYFNKKRNDRIFSMYGELKHREL